MEAPNTRGFDNGIRLPIVESFYCLSHLAMKKPHHPNSFDEVCEQDGLRLVSWAIIEQAARELGDYPLINQPAFWNKNASFPSCWPPYPRIND